MGVTVQGSTIASKTIEHDDDVPFDLPEHGGGVPSFAFASMGTGPALTNRRGGSAHCRFRVTTGSGTPAIAANNIQITCSRAPRKVFLYNGESAPGFHVASISGNVINIGTKVAPAASTAYDFEIVVLF
jgi:hypothetical protein